MSEAVRYLVYSGVLMVAIWAPMLAWGASGLDTRPGNETCKAPQRPATALAVKRVFPALSFQQPIYALQAPGDDSRWYVIEKPGRIWTFDATDDAVATKRLVLDIRSSVNDASEGGLLSMAFHPRYPEVKQAFISYTTAGAFRSRLARLNVSNDGLRLDPRSETEILTVAQPYKNHNGGHIAFGADGYLYFGVGDGGSGGDPQNNGQNRYNLLGAFLRLDVDAATPYAIPTDNPFASGGGAPEIFAWGFRNPWRWSFDRADGATLWAGDVGQGKWEEVDIVKKGLNYGWRCYEGKHAFKPGGCQAASAYEGPVAEYGHDEGSSITGGYVYRGSELGSLYGTYVFGDFSNGVIWGLSPDGSGYRREQLVSSGLSIASFAQDADGELYVVDFGGGLYRFAREGAASGGPETLLSQTGCVDPSNPSEPAPGVIPYGTNLSFWSDGAYKERFLAIPDRSTIRISADGDFLFPIGTVLLKHFRLNGILNETRLFTRHEDGGWGGYTYRWNPDQTDAVLLAGAFDEEIGGQTWHYPSRGECMRCHNQAADFSLGVEALQLNRELLYEQTGRTANQLDTLEAIRIVDAEEGFLPIHRALKLFAADDESASSDARARSYLHVNCAYCHRPGGPARGDLDLRFTTPLQAMGICNVPPGLGNLGIEDARLLVPGEPERSVLLKRLETDGENRMPPLASNVLDVDGANLIRAWIAQVATCDQPSPDADSDGVADLNDNCIRLRNPYQRDTDRDGFGNRCDPDFDGDSVVGPFDLSTFKTAFGSKNAADQDLNGNGTVDPFDLGILKSFFGKPPGPSCCAP